MKGKGQASSGSKPPPRPREFRSAGAAVARTVAAMPAPKKVAVVLKETGGSDSVVVAKALRGGERVLSSRVNSFAYLSVPDDTTDLTNAPAAANNA